MVVAGIERLGHVPAQILGIAGERLTDAGQDDLTAHRRREGDHGGHDQDRPRDAPAAHAGCQQRREFVVSLQPRDGEHRAGQRDDRAGRVEKPDQPAPVVGTEHPREPARLGRVRDELLHVREGVDHEVEAGKAHEHDHEGVDHRPGDVAVDEHGRRRGRRLDGGTRGPTMWGVGREGRGG